MGPHAEYELALVIFELAGEEEFVTLRGELGFELREVADPLRFALDQKSVEGLPPTPHEFAVNQIKAGHHHGLKHEVAAQLLNRVDQNIAAAQL